MFFTNNRYPGSALLMAIFISVMIALFMLLLIQVKKSSIEVAQRAISFFDLMHLHDEFIGANHTDEWNHQFVEALRDKGYEVQLQSRSHGLWLITKLSIRRGDEEENRTYLLVPNETGGKNSLEIRDNNRIIDVGYGMKGHGPILVPKGKVNPHKPDVYFDSEALQLMSSSAYTVPLDSHALEVYNHLNNSSKLGFITVDDTLPPFDTIRAETVHVESSGFLQHNLIIADSVYIQGNAGCAQFLVRSLEMDSESSLKYPSFIFSMTDTISAIQFRQNTDFRGYVYAYGYNHLIEKPQLTFYENSHFLGEFFTNGSVVKYGNSYWEGRFRLNDIHKINQQGKLYVLDSLTLNEKNIFQGPYISLGTEGYKVVWYGKS